MGHTKGLPEGGPWDMEGKVGVEGVGVARSDHIS